MKQLSIIVAAVILLVGGGALLSNNLSSHSNNDGADPVVSKNGIHYHPTLEIYIDDEKQELPSGIGLVGGHSPIHTHDTDGVIHLEFNGLVKESDTELGKFFKVWGKTFGATQLFEFENNDEKQVHMTVNGIENTEFDSYKMKDGDAIIIRYE